MTKKSEKIRLSEAKVLAMQPVSGKSQTLIGDADQPGLFLRITSAGGRSYVFEGSIRGKSLRLTIGAVSDWSLPAARAKVREFQAQIDAGHDPRDMRALDVDRNREELDRRRRALEAAEAEAKRQTLTLADVWPRYIRARSMVWGDHHKRDHDTLTRRPGAPVFRGTRPAAGGPLASLLDVRLADMTATKLESWLAEETAKRPTMTAKAFRVLRAFLTWCDSEEDLVGLLPPAGMGYKAKKVREKLAKPPAKEDALDRLLLPDFFRTVRNLPNRQHGTFLQIMLLMGCRPGELLSLRWVDVDLRLRAMTLRDKDESKGGKDGRRIVPFGPYVGSLLSSLHNAAPKDDQGLPRSAYVFASRNLEASGPMSSPNHALATVAAVAGLPHLTLHGLRRSYASLTEWIELPVGVRAQIMGHKPSATAERHYIVRPLDLLRLYQDKFEAWVLAEAGQFKSEPKNGLVLEMRGIYVS